MKFFGTDITRTMYLCSSERMFGRSFLEVFPFSEGKGAVRDRRGAYFIDTDGRPIGTERYRRTYPYRDGTAAVEDDLGMHHIGHDGKALYSRRFGWVSDYSDGLCAVRYRNGMYTYIDREGRTWEREYRHAGDFHDGTAAVLDGEGFTHIDTEGRSVHGMHFDLCLGFDGDKAPVMEGGSWYLVGRDGCKVAGPYDRIGPARGGMFPAVKEGTVGFIGPDLVFSPMCNLVEEPGELPLPGWTDDISDHGWDSCVVFIRHSERGSHYLCNLIGAGSTALTPEGERYARRIGEKLRPLSDRKVGAYCSDSRRCITTANCIMAAMGSVAKVDVSPEIGLEGKAFLYPAPWDSDEPGTVALFRQLEGDILGGWYTNEQIRSNLFDMFKRLMAEDDTLTFCVNHDMFVIPLIAIATGRFPCDRWTDYCDGALVIRRGEKYYIVVDGREYPFPAEGPVSVDVSPAPSSNGGFSGTVADTDDMEIPRLGRAAWAGPLSEGMRTVADGSGRFIVVRSDGYPMCNQSFGFAGEYAEQCVPVCIGGRGATHVTDCGDLLHNRWFTECKEYSEGCAAVHTGGGWNYVDTQGRMLFEGGYREAFGFVHGEALVLTDMGLCRIDRAGTRSLLG